MVSEARRIIVVDDDDAIRDIIKATLGPPEFETSVFADARDALRELPRLRPDLIVSDLLMPEMDGWTFFQHVKQVPQLRDVPFVFLSAVRSDQAMIKSLENGADDFVSKPFVLKALVAKVRATLRRIEKQAPAGPDRLSGTLGSAGTLPVLQFLEGNRLTARLTVSSAGIVWWAEFRNGDLVAAGPPDLAGPDPIKALLGVREGSYVIEQATETLPVPAPAAALASAGPPMAVAPPPAAVAPAEAASQENGLLLASALSQLAAEVRHHLDGVMTLTLLRRTQAAAARLHPALRAFRVGEDGEVSCATPGHFEVSATAEWVGRFLGEAGALDRKVARIKPRQATSSLAPELERIGWYAALEARS